MTPFEEVLRDNGYQFSSLLDEAGKEELVSLWETMSASEGGALSYSDLEAILDGYREVGVIEPVFSDYSCGNFARMEKASGRKRPKEEPYDNHPSPLSVAGTLMSQENYGDRTSSDSDVHTGELPDGQDEHFSHDSAAARVISRLDDACGAKNGIIPPSAHYTGVRKPQAESSGKSSRASSDGRASSDAHSSSDGRASKEDLLKNPETWTPPEKAAPADVTYKIVTSNEHLSSVGHPIMILEDPDRRLLHHQTGDFVNPERRTAFECHVERDGRKNLVVADILYIDKRFIRLLSWLGSNHFLVRLSGRPRAEGYAVYKIHAYDPNGNDTLESANDSFLQFNIRRLLAGDAPEDLTDEEKDRLSDDHMMLTDIASMTDFLNISGDTLPSDIRSWAHRNIALVKTDTISPEEKRHAQRALSIMLNIQWKGSYFESIDPAEARRILDEELYGMEKVKQRVIETIIQINRTHTLPAYGLLLVGPAGTGKSQIAYAVAKILKLPWAALDMSAIHDAEALTGSPRVYSNAKPGRIMEAFSQAGASNIVFIINELDKAESRSSSGNPADALLTLLDNLGYTDNYIECVIPTGGVYPIATANDKTKISDPLLTRFAMIEIPDYTPDEKATIFREFSLPKVLRRMGMTSDEITVTDDAVKVIIDHYRDMPGVRDMEQAAEHLAANALYQIETTGVKTIVFDAEQTKSILEN